MTCDCKHNRDGQCRRFPPVRTVENGRNVWQFPPASAECGEKASPDQVPAETQNPASKRARTAAKSKSKAVTHEG